MRKTFTIILAALILGATTSFAQTIVRTTESIQVSSSQKTGIKGIHRLTFMELPISGHVKLFKRALRQKSFIPSGSPALNILKGSFAGHNITVHLATTPLSNNVYAVYAYTEARDSWNDVVAEFKTFKERFTSVYGLCSVELDAEYARFTENPYLQSKAGPVDAFAQWTLDNGSITIMTDKAEDGRGRILIAYVDKFGSAFYNVECNRKIEKDL